MKFVIVETQMPVSLSYIKEGKDALFELCDMAWSVQFSKERGAFLIHKEVFEFWKSYVEECQKIDNILADLRKTYGERIDRALEGCRGYDHWSRLKVVMDSLKEELSAYF